MKKFKIYPAFIMVVIAITGFSFQSQAQEDFFSSFSGASTTVQPTTPDKPEKPGQTEQKVAKGNKKAGTTSWLYFDGRRNIQTKLMGLYTDDGMGGAIDVRLFNKGWVYFVQGRYVPDRSGLFLGIGKNLLRNPEAKIVPSVELMAGMGQQISGIRSDIDLGQTGNLDHSYISYKLRPQVEAGINIEFKVARKMSLFLGGGVIYRANEGEKTALSSSVNIDDATVTQGKVDFTDKKIGFKASFGLSYVFLK